MDVIMDCYFDDVFSKLDRGFLLARYKRRELVEYFSTVIRGCYQGQEQPSTDSACNRAVLSAIKFHNLTRDKNGDICLLGKYHNVLYIAAKLAFDWKLSQSPTVSSLLDGMYTCEKTFERLFTGAILGTRASHLISGWKSDFDNTEQNMKAMIYFVYHSTKCRREYGGRRIVDVPMESYGGNTPAGLCMQVSNAQVLLVLLRFGAQLQIGSDPKTCPLLQLIQNLNDFYVRGLTPCPEILYCLRLSLRSVVSVPVKFLESHSLVDEIDEKLIKDHLPDSRCGRTPPELRHLSKLAVRNELLRNFQLPDGIKNLLLPESLKRYLDLEYD